MTTKTYGLLCLCRTTAEDNLSQADTKKFTLPEIHLNIWEQTHRNHAKEKALEAFLDIGLMIDLNDQMSELLLILPWEVKPDQIEDLSSLIATPEAIPAVFNESWAVAKQGNLTVVYEPSGEKSFALVALSKDDYSNKIQCGYNTITIDVNRLRASATAAIADTCQTANRLYVRFRVHGVPREFYSVGAHEQMNAWWSPSWQRTEDIDFRLNVRRGAPVGLENSVKAHFVKFSKVHLFLMRSREKDIIFQDKLFKASRSLEDEEFWAKYSLPKGENDSQSNLKRVKSSLGYQWKLSEPPVSEFATLARFKVVEFGIGKFLLVAVLVGACGSMMWDALKTIKEAVYPAMSNAIAAPVCITKEDLVKELAVIRDAKGISESGKGRQITCQSTKGGAQ